MHVLITEPRTNAGGMMKDNDAGICQFPVDMEVPGISIDNPSDGIIL